MTVFKACSMLKCMGLHTCLQNTINEEQFCNFKECFNHITSYHYITCRWTIFHNSKTHLSSIPLLSKYHPHTASKTPNCYEASVWVSRLNRDTERGVEGYNYPNV